MTSLVDGCAQSLSRERFSRTVEGRSPALTRVRLFLCSTDGFCFEAPALRGFLLEVSRLSFAFSGNESGDGEHRKSCEQHRGWDERGNQES